MWTESLQTGELIPVARRISRRGARRGGSGVDEDIPGGEDDEALHEDDDDAADRHSGGGGATGSDDAPLLPAPSLSQLQPDGSVLAAPKSSSLISVRTAQRTAYLIADLGSLICSFIPILINMTTVRTAASRYLFFNYAISPR